MKPQLITAAPVKKMLRVKASQATAFEVFTARIGSWWPQSHHIGKVDMKEAVIEPRQGGRWYERGVDGSECEWGTVLAWQPPEKIVLSWYLNSKFEYDRSIKSEVEVRFIAEGANTTRVELEHRISAADAEIIRDKVDAPGGWTMLLDLYAQKATV
jgi:uncharacterized protein YndB with AHSA1/START domain